ncbi:MAG: GAF domain-containing protein [Myxococcales bacterium]|nr:GAF domain-containing protein [Myxococcales bacterium]
MSSSRLNNEPEQLELLHRVGIALTAERNRDRLIELILIEAQKLCDADAGSLYLRTDDDQLRFVIMRTTSLGIALGGTTGKPINLPPIPLHDPLTGTPNHENVASHAALLGRSVHVPDAYDEARYDFAGTYAFDRRNNYRSTSLFTVPLINSEQRVIGVLQLLNARRGSNGETGPFSESDRAIVEALASQAAVALDNQMLLQAQRDLLESFIQMIASSIDAKSPYTGAHCERVPELVEMLAQAVCDTHDGPLAAFSLDDDRWYELKIAAWLHDCGKVVTPVHIMDKATKLEAIYDRIDAVRARVEIVKRDIEIAHLRDVLAGRAQPEQSELALQAVMRELDGEMAFLERANIGAEFIRDEDRLRIEQLGKRRFRVGDRWLPLLTADEIEHLSISRGTLTAEERLIINGHMVETIRMLDSLPFPRHLSNVPEYAGGHHEKMDGSGYPKGIYAGDMSVPARIMAIADVFEALTAQDRPYKPGKTLSEAMRIMGFMKRDNHLDPDLFDIFVRSGVYRVYGERFLPKSQLDEVNEAGLLAIEPRPFDLPAYAERKTRQADFLPHFRAAPRHTSPPVRLPIVAHR